MRQITLVRGGALLTAAALTLSLGAGPASAEPTHNLRSAAAVTEDRPGARLATGADLHGGTSTTPRSARAARAASAATAVNVVKLKAYSTELYPGDNFIDVDVFLNEDADQSTIDSITLNLSVDGKKTSNLPVEVFFEEDDVEQSNPITYVTVSGKVGLGKAKFTGSTVHYTEESGFAPTNDGTDSNSFYVRRAIVSGDPFFESNGTKKTFHVRNVGIYKPSIDAFTSLKKIKLQYKKGGKWKTQKTVKLDAEGNGTYSYRASKSYPYRIYSAKTTTSAGLVLAVGQAS